MELKKESMQENRLNKLILSWPRQGISQTISLLSEMLKMLEGIKEKEMSKNISDGHSKASLTISSQEIRETQKCKDDKQSVSNTNDSLPASQFDSTDPAT